MRLSAIWEVHQIYASDIFCQAEWESWPAEQLSDALQRNHAAEMKEARSFLNRLGDRELQDQIRSWNHSLTLDDSSEEERQALNEDSDSASSPNINSDKPSSSDTIDNDEDADESSEEEVNALPHFGYDRSVLSGFWPPRYEPMRRRPIGTPCGDCGCFHIDDDDDDDNDDDDTEDDVGMSEDDNDQSLEPRLADNSDLSRAALLPLHFKVQIADVCSMLESSLGVEVALDDDWGSEENYADIEDSGEEPNL